MMTTRVLTLRAAAIQVVVRRTLGLRIGRAEAEWLAKGGSIARALDELEARLQVRRAAPGVPAHDDAFQCRLAVAEVAAELGGALGDHERHRLVERLLDVEAEQRASERQIAGSSAAVEAMLGDFLARGEALGAFARAVQRLRSDQEGRLALGVADRQLRDQARREIDDIHRRYLELAFRFT